jgi:predicted RNase H-like nuclease (RuvC/YqgF family)
MMSEENAEVVNESEETVTEENTEVAELRAELERYKAKQAETEKHRKEAERKAKEIERAQAEAERKKAEEEGNHQKLWETERERADRLEAELAERDKLLQEREQREIDMTRNAETKSIALDLAVDAASAEDLAALIKDKVVYEDGNVVYQVDGVKVDKNRFVKYIQTRHPRLVRGSGMTGGGATGATNSSSAASVNKGQEAKAKGDLTGFLQAQFNN